MLVLVVLCRLTLPEELDSSPPPLFSITALSASCIELIQYCCCCCCCSSLLLESSSPVINNTFFTRPPSVVISAFNVLKRNALSVLMRSGNRSDRSSQHSEALITNLPSSSDASSTISSSISVGTGLVSAITEVCRFSSFTCCITSASNEALSVYHHKNNQSNFFRLAK